MEKPIKGFEDYTVTENGIIYSHKTSTPHQIRGFINKGGYQYVDLCKNNTVTRFAVHQLVALHYVDGWFEGAMVNHIDSDKLNNHYTNLEWVTQGENVRKSYITSGVGATRNYRYHILVYPDGRQTEPFKGQQPIKDYIAEHCLDISFSMLLRRGHSRGYQLITLH